MKKILIFLTLIFVPLLAGAYTETTVGDSITSAVTPKNPSANQIVTISLLSYGVDLNSANISWQLDGVSVSSGIGKSNYSFTTGAIGTKKTVTVAITSQSGKTTNKTFVFQSADVDLLWEAKTYTPPFYKGKALPTSESLIKVNAISNLIGSDGQSLKSSNLIYTWKKDGRNLPTMSGYGKSSIVFKSDKLFGQNNISVEVANLAGDIKAEKNIIIPIRVPKILFYEQKPLDGIIYNQALSQGKIGDEDFILRAEPYFFSSKDLDSLTYGWSLNNKAVEAKGITNILAVAANKDSGSNNLFKLEINNPNSLLQSAANSINFTKQKNIFGF